MRQHPSLMDNGIVAQHSHSNFDHQLSWPGLIKVILSTSYCLLSGSSVHEKITSVIFVGISEQSSSYIHISTARAMQLGLNLQILSEYINPSLMQILYMYYILNVTWYKSNEILIVSINLLLVEFKPVFLSEELF